jgi:hypothetical protein
VRSARLGYLALIAVSLGYFALNLARGASPLARLLPLGSFAGQLCLAVYWGFFFQHFYIDQKIWRPSKDPLLQFELGLRPAP